VMTIIDLYCRRAPLLIVIEAWLVEAGGRRMIGGKLQFYQNLIFRLELLCESF